MNILKHMEAVFIATLALAVSSSYLIDAIPEAQAKAPATASAAAPSVAVVTVSAKRMTAAEKAQSLRDDSQVTATRATPASRM